MGNGRDEQTPLQAELCGFSKRALQASGQQGRLPLTQSTASLSAQDKVLVPDSGLSGNRQVWFWWTYTHESENGHSSTLKERKTCDKSNDCTPTAGHEKELISEQKQVMLREFDKRVFLPLSLHFSQSVPS